MTISRRLPNWLHLQLTSKSALAGKETEAVVLNAQVTDRAVFIPEMVEWTKVGLEGTRSHELGPPTHEHVIDAVKPGTL